MSTRLGNIVQLGIKQLRGLARDPIMLALIFYSFTVAVYSASTSTLDTLNYAPIAIVDEDRSPLSSRIASAFYPPYFKPPELISQQEMDSRMDAGLDTFTLDIPPNFQRDLLAGRSPSIQLNIDATRMAQAFSGAGYVESIISSEIDAFSRRIPSAADASPELVVRARYNQELKAGCSRAANSRSARTT